MLVPILFALGTAVFWGMYGPAIGNAHSKLPPPDGWSPFKPYVFIGLAYFVLAILGGLIAMHFKGDTFRYSGEHWSPAKWGFVTGCLGALGGLCLTTAMMMSKGNALLVMPIVFGGAVSVTALFSVYRLAGAIKISPLLWVGMVLVVGGIVLVARNTPHAAKAPPKTSRSFAPADAAAPVPDEAPPGT
jgi:drug/metabolite transporter (DMT)-like permease